MTVKELLYLHNTTGAEIGSKLGVTRSNVSRWTSGTSKPNAKRVRDIASVLGVEVETVTMAVIETVRQREGRKEETQ